MATHQKKHIKAIYTNKELLICSEKDDEAYGQITESKGDARFQVKLLKTNVLHIAKARGALIKGPRKQRLLKNDYVLLQKDISSDDTKYFIIHKYSNDDVKKLKKLNELTTICNDDDDDDDDNKHQIIFDGDILQNSLEEVNINDDFIAQI